MSDTKEFKQRLLDEIARHTDSIGIPSINLGRFVRNLRTIIEAEQVAEATEVDIEVTAGRALHRANDAIERIEKIEAGKREAILSFGDLVGRIMRLEKGLEEKSELLGEFYEELTATADRSRENVKQLDEIRGATQELACRRIMTDGQVDVAHKELADIKAMVHRCGTSLADTERRETETRKRMVDLAKTDVQRENDVESAHERIDVFFRTTCEVNQQHEDRMLGLAKRIDNNKRNVATALKLRDKDQLRLDAIDRHLTSKALSDPGAGPEDFFGNAVELKVEQCITRLDAKDAEINNLDRRVDELCTRVIANDKTLDCHDERIDNLEHPEPSRDLGAVGPGFRIASAHSRLDAVVESLEEQEDRVDKLEGLTNELDTTKINHRLSSMGEKNVEIDDRVRAHGRAGLDNDIKISQHHMRLNAVGKKLEELDGRADMAELHHAFANGVRLNIAERVSKLENS